jgi:hypothetical protein
MMSGAAAAPLLHSAPARKPNFLLILADDMGFSDAHCYGGSIDTPNIDRLAAGGLRFTQGYSTARCGPSRSTLLHGVKAAHPDLAEKLAATWQQHDDEYARVREAAPPTQRPRMARG